MLKPLLRDPQRALPGARCGHRANNTTAACAAVRRT